MLIGFNEVTLEELALINCGHIDGDKGIVVIGDYTLWKRFRLF